MSMTLSSLQPYSKTPIKVFSPKISPRFHHFNPSFPFSSPSTAKAKPLNKFQSAHNFYGPFKKNFNGFPVKSCGFIVKAQNDSDFTNNGEKEEIEARGQSSMPERFRYLAKEAPAKLARWPLFILLLFVLYAWRTVLWELTSWGKVVGSIIWFFGFIPILVLDFMRFIPQLIIALISDLISYLINIIRPFYSGIVAYAPITELTEIIMLTSVILAVAEASVPDSVNNQPYLLAVAGLIGFAAVRNYISEVFFWTLLLGLFGYARLVKKRDYVSSALPVAAVLAAVGEPWVRVIVMASYLTLAIMHHYLKPVDSNEDEEDGRGIKRAPVPLLCAALAIGIRVAAKWAGYRHLTWMIV